MPSPLCDKEYEDVFFNPNSPTTDMIAEELNREVEAIVKSASKMGFFTDTANNIVNVFLAYHML